MHMQHACKNMQYAFKMSTCMQYNMHANICNMHANICKACKNIATCMQIYVNACNIVTCMQKYM